MKYTISATILLILTAAFSAPNPAGAPGAHPVRWGQNGHRVVGQIAQNHLSPAAAAAVAKLLGPGDATLAQASTWADEIKSDPHWRYASPWHYITIEDDVVFDHLPPVPDAPEQIHSVVDAIAYFTSVLKDPSSETQARIEALRFLVHFVGDIHQPLHVGRGADRGGNDVRIDWFGSNSNLHRVWDSDLIDSQHLSFSEYTSFIDHASPDQIEAWQHDSVLVWAVESRALRSAVYDFHGGTLDSTLEANYRDLTIRLGYDYTFRKKPLVEQRLVQAGIRLAGLLNDIFGA